MQALNGSGEDGTWLKIWLTMFLNQGGGSLSCVSLGKTTAASWGPPQQWFSCSGPISSSILHLGGSCFFQRDWHSHICEAALSADLVRIAARSAEIDFFGGCGSPEAVDWIGRRCSRHAPEGMEVFGEVWLESAATWQTRAELGDSSALARCSAVHTGTHLRAYLAYVVPENRRERAQRTHHRCGCASAGLPFSGLGPGDVHQRG